MINYYCDSDSLAQKPMSFHFTCPNKKSSYSLFRKRGEIVKSREKFQDDSDLEYYMSEDLNHNPTKLVIVQTPVVLEIESFDIHDRDLCKAALESLGVFLSTMTLRRTVHSGNSMTPKRAVFLPLSGFDEIRITAKLNDRHVIEKMHRFCQRISTRARVFIDYKI